jgi:class 3 adenylate cyclase
MPESQAVTRCPACTGALPPGGRFCPSCGMPVVSATRTQTRKHVVILFTDLVGFTPIGERLDPEALERVLDLYFGVAVESVASHGGIVEKFIGDAVMAVFGLPARHGDDGARAVHAAVRLHREIDRLNAGELAEFGVVLSLRTGIGAGEVAVSARPDGSPRVIGDAVNTSARLQQAARPGEILLGDTVAWMVRGVADLEARPPLTVKGKSATLSTWTVRSLSAARPRPSAPLIGREAELALLGRQFDQVSGTGQGALVLLSGPAGIGKSRLLAEAPAGWGEARVIATLCPAWGGGPLDPVRQLAEAAFGDGWPDDLPARLAGSPDPDRVAELLLRGLGLRPGPTGERETAWSLRQLLTAVAGGGPLIVTCDDFHHADEALREVIRLALPGIEAPVLFIAAARPEFPAACRDWLTETSSTHIAVGPLDPDQSRALVSALTSTPGSEAAAAVDDRIWLAAEGNPLFAEQLVAAVREDPTIRVPPTVQSLLEAQLDRLADAERSLLQRAAVVGPTFTVDDVSALAGYPPAIPLEPTIGDLVGHSMLSPTAGPAGRSALRFVPGLLHDTAYGSTPKAERSRWHEAFGRWLIGRQPGEPEVIGHHLEAAYQYGVAVGGAAGAATVAADAATYLFASAELADNRGDLHGAADTLRRGLRLLPPGDPRQRDAALLLADLCGELGELGGAREAVEQADVAASDLAWPTVKRLQTAIIDLREDESRLAAVSALAAAPLPAAAAADPEARLRHYLLTAYVAVAEMRLGTASGALMAALEYTGDRERNVDSILIGLAELALWGPEPAGDAIARCELLAARLAGDRARLVTVQGVHACLLALTGQFAAGRELAGVARASAAELQMEYALIALGQMTGLVEALAEDHPAAEAEYRRSADAWRDAGQLAYAASMDVLAARAWYEQGQLTAADDLLRGCADQVSERDVTGQAARWSLRALLDSAAGRHQLAREAALKAVEFSASTDDPRGRGDARCDQARVLLAAGDRAGAARAAGQAADFYQAKGATVLTARASALREACQ